MLKAVPLLLFREHEPHVRHQHMQVLLDSIDVELALDVFRAVAVEFG